ncbi:hypothetical protein [Streptomyces sp. Isolate_219]|uniref:hypothetical protein n=1 Tax=Streptomyces sp. Isolate_219 TaxID=2950110 RepID=UPI002905B1FB|nr:hypothetical protein [Streptomyces sp. Isolate_219]
MGPSKQSAAGSPLLHAAFDVLVGQGRWASREALGGFVVRFPGGEPAVVDGWHIDASFPGEDLEAGSTDYMRWRANVESRDCALRMFFLFSDVGEGDAPTRIRVGSHLDAARVLEPEGETAWTPESLPGAQRPPPGIARSRTPRARPGTSISATRSWCTLANRTAERVRASWASRSSPRPSRSGSRGRTGPTHRSRSRSDAASVSVRPTGK